MRQVHRIKPNNELKIRFPGIKRFLKAEGEFVEWSSYWQRRLNDKDVTIISSMTEEKKFIEDYEAQVASVDEPKVTKKTKKIDQGVEL